MNPQTLQEAKLLWNSTRTSIEYTRNVDVVICPPFTYIQPLTKLKRPKNMYLGAQNVAHVEKGAFTGEVSASQVKDVGASYVIVGHSERRYPLRQLADGGGETDEIISKKLIEAFKVGLTPVLCIGEKERDREASYLSLIKEQLKGALTGLSKKDLVGIHIAYEPVWAIGKSYRESMNPTDIHEMVLLIRKALSELFGIDIGNGARLIYGGSVESENATDVLNIGNVTGFLVGHASLSKEEFGKILKAADVKS